MLNAPVLVGHFHRPWVMEPLAHRGIAAVYLRMLTPPLFRWLMGRQGVADLTKVSRAELDAYLALLRYGDGGRAFLKIMRGFELTQAKEDCYTAVLRDRRYPVQIVWGGQDPSLTLAVRGDQALRAAGLTEVTMLPGKISCKKIRLLRSPTRWPPSLGWRASLKTGHGPDKLTPPWFKPQSIT